MTTVNVGRVKLLIHALLSDEFQQGTGSLEKTESLAVINPEDGMYRYEAKVKNCCLGVACRIAQLAGLEITDEITDNTVVRFSGETGYLPVIVQEWFGFNRGNPMLVTADGIESTAVDLNDSRKFSFKEIAEAFRRTYVTPVPVREPVPYDPTVCNCAQCTERREIEADNAARAKAAQVANDLAAMTATVAAESNVEPPTTEVEAA